MQCIEIPHFVIDTYVPNLSYSWLSVICGHRAEKMPVIYIPALEAQGLEFGSQHPLKKLGAEICAYHRQISMSSGPTWSNSELQDSQSYREMNEP